MKYDVYGRMTEVKEWSGSALVAISDANSNGFIDASEYFAGSLTKNPFLFQGQRLDEESGLYYFKNRYYDPATGRFITRDPKGFVDGPNLYAFVNNNPINFLDPMGTTSITMPTSEEKCAAELEYFKEHPEKYFDELDLSTANEAPLFLFDTSSGRYSDTLPGPSLRETLTSRFSLISPDESLRSAAGDALRDYVDERTNRSMMERELQGLGGPLTLKFGNVEMLPLIDTGEPLDVSMFQGLTPDPATRKMARWTGQVSIEYFAVGVGYVSATVWLQNTETGEEWKVSFGSRDKAINGGGLVANCSIWSLPSADFEFYSSCRGECPLGEDSKVGCAFFTLGFIIEGHFNIYKIGPIKGGAEENYKVEFARPTLGVGLGIAAFPGGADAWFESAERLK